MTLDDTLDALVEREGGYVNDPTDRGGETNWGITIAVARAFGYTGEMAQMPRETAKTIYRERYWRQPKFDQVYELSPSIAEELLDTGVNMGQGVAAGFLQRALNVLNQGGTVFPDLVQDNAIGRMTLYALRTFLDLRGLDGRDVLLRMLNAQQAVRYMELAEDSPSQEKYEYGWQRTRVA